MTMHHAGPFAVFLVLCTARIAGGANIVVLEYDFYFPNSHFLVVNRVIDELAARGHRLLVRTSFRRSFL
jgi:hypothetical protein